MPQARGFMIVSSLTVALTLVTACSPAASLQASEPFVQAWQGPVETVAIVMSQPERRFDVLANRAMRLVEATFAGHPYAQQRFDVIERTALERILDEHRLSSGGFVDPDTAPRLGALLGAQYIMVVDLVGADVRDSRARLPGLGGGAATVSVSVNARLVDVQTGRVVANGLGSVEATVLTRLQTRGAGVFTTSAGQDLVLELVPEATMRALNDAFRRIA